VHVKDVHKHPVPGLEIGLRGEAGTAITDDNGKARIPLAPYIKEKSWVSLQIVKSPSGEDFTMISPWDSAAQVPSFQSGSDNSVEVMVVQGGDRTALASDTVLKAVVSQINKANAPRSSDKQADPANPKGSMSAAAKQLGLSSDDLDRAIRAWGARTTDPYNAGLVALYAKDYEKATNDFQAYLSRGSKKSQSNENTAADAAFFLGQSLLEQSKYRESAEAYQRCLQAKPDNAVALKNAVFGLVWVGDYTAAEPLAQKALAIDEKTLGPGDPEVATDLNAIGRLLRNKGDYAAAEPLLRRALAIDEKALGSDHPGVASDLNNLAMPVPTVHSRSALKH